MTADYRKFLETPTFCCVIDVVGWGRLGDYPGWMNVGIISMHAHYDWRTWRARIARARAALFGEAQPFVEFHTGKDVAAFVGALTEASAVAFVEAVAGSDI